ncbi:hypothetical protein MMC34_005737 [Xylographa carneopallida]|nr:hypothetical protein [Xylographa carneopallida]
MDDSNFNCYHYSPSLAAAIVFIVLFVAVTVLHIFRLLRTRTWYFTALVVGGFFEWIGYIGRAISATQTPDWTLGPFLLQTLLLLVAPGLFAASIYMQLGRIIRVTGGEKYFLVRRTWLTKVFVIGDVVSFGIQAAGKCGGLISGQTIDGINNGEKVIVIGLVVQIVFFGFFTVVASLFNYRLRRASKLVAVDVENMCQKYLNALYVSSILIMVRSIVRVLEFLKVGDSYIMQNEWFIYVFDSVLMLAVMVVFLVVYPSDIRAKLRASSTEELEAR